MVNGVEQLDRIFGALSDATRRDMLASLANGERNVGALAAPYSMSQPAVSKHLRVLENAGLIRRKKRGREHFIAVNPETTDVAQQWIARYSAFWKAQFDAVDDYLKEQGKAHPDNATPGADGK
ncbi:MAG: metalloregulator ArsR/SmtB family transcription factor [Planctomycetota bacterium]